MPVFRLSKCVLAVSIPLLSLFGDAYFGLSTTTNAIFQRILLAVLTVLHFFFSEPKHHSDEYESQENTIKTLLIQNAHLYHEIKQTARRLPRLSLGQSQSWHAGLGQAL